MMLALRVAAFLVAVAMSGAPAEAGPTAQPLNFSDLAGWADDDHAAALDAFRVTCPTLNAAEWQEACADSGPVTDARAFFEKHFRPYLVGGAKPALITGYYEPEIPASLERSPLFAYPIYAKPPELVPGTLWYSRDEIETRGLLRGRGLEIAWLQDPVDVFFLQVQGSGRLKLPNGDVLRVGFAAKNGQPYRSIGAELVRRGEISRAQASAQAIRLWVQRHPDQRDALFAVNPSFIFFRVLDRHPSSLGPLGALDLPVTAGRSIAVDPAYTPLGAPVWVETTGPRAMHRLMVAQDVGSAIKGPQRGDVFMGTGAKAGRIAGRMKDQGRMIVLLPVDTTQLAAGEGR